MIPFGYNLAAWRRARGLRQEELAKRAGLLRPNLSAIERGRHDVTLATARQLAVAVGISLSELTEQSPPSPVSELDRHDIDQVAQAVVSGERSLTAEENRLADEITGLVIPLLEAHQMFGARGRRRRSDNGHRRILIYVLYGPELVERILKRVEKHLT